MSPLYEGNRVFQDDESHSLHWWANLLGFTPQTIKSAAATGNVPITIGEPMYEGCPAPKLIYVGDFSQLIAGFQNTGLRPDGIHFHTWTLGVHTNNEAFPVVMPNGTELTYIAPELIANLNQD